MLFFFFFFLSYFISSAGVKGCCHHLVCLITSEANGRTGGRSMTDGGIIMCVCISMAGGLALGT